MNNKSFKRKLIIYGCFVAITIALVFVLGKINPILQLFSISLAGFAIILFLSQLRPLIIETLKEDKNQEETKSTSKYCPYCGAKIENDFLYCNNCGKKLP